jgi:hypothetical protein
MTVVATAGNLNNVSGENCFSASLKNGYSNLIHSMNIQCSNNSVVSTMSFSNLAINYKLLTSMSTDDEQNLGDSIGFKKDDTLSIGYKSASSPIGLGETNNVIASSNFNPSSGFAGSSFTQNKGRLSRMANTSFDPATTGDSVGSLNVSGRNYCVRDTLGALGKTVVYNIIANIPLSHLSSFFEKYPLCKGSYLTITLNTNTACSSQLTIDGGGNYTSVSSSSQNGSVPFMVSPVGTGSGINIAGTTPCTGLEVSIAIAKNSLNKSGTTFSHPSLSSCRLYACMIDVTPSAEQLYLSKSGGTKKTIYEDFQTYQTLNVAVNGGNFSQILTNGLSRARRIVGFPMLSATANFAGTAGFISPMASPFTSCPTTGSKSPISGFNVLLSGANLFQQNIQYGWEHFQNKLRRTGINGGLSLGLSSGLISQNDFENGYRFIVADISRCNSEAQDNIARSIQVIGTNSGDRAIDAYWVVFYEREVEIDLSTGSLIM